MTAVVRAFSQHLEKQAAAAALEKLEESRQAVIAAPCFGPALKASLLAFSLVYSVFLWEHAGKSFLSLFFLPSQCGSSGHSADGASDASMASLQAAAAAAASGPGLWNNLCVPLLLQQTGQDASAAGAAAAAAGVAAGTRAAAGAGEKSSSSIKSFFTPCFGGSPATPGGAADGDASADHFSAVGLSAGGTGGAAAVASSSPSSSAGSSAPSITWSDWSFAVATITK